MLSFLINLRVYTFYTALPLYNEAATLPRKYRTEMSQKIDLL